MERQRNRKQKSREIFPERYFAFVVSVNSCGNRREILLDAIPKSELMSHLYDSQGGDDKSRQSRLYAHFPANGLVIRVVQLRQRVLAEHSGRGRKAFQAGRWYEIELTRKGIHQFVPSADMDADPSPCGLRLVTALLSFKSERLNSLFTLRGAREPGAPEDWTPEPGPEDGGGPRKGQVSGWRERGEAAWSGSASAEWKLYRELISTSQLSSMFFNNFSYSRREFVYRLGACFLHHAPGSGRRAVSHHGRRRYLGVMNVGQGACAALFDEELKPIVYFDLGMPCSWYIKTAPWNANYLLRNGHHLSPTGSWYPMANRELRHPRPCLCMSPTVVFSHGDYDHWRAASAIKGRFAGPNALPAIAPEAVACSSLNDLWKDFTDTSTISVGKYRSFFWGHLVVCEGNDKNNAGIAAYVRVKDRAGGGYMHHKFGVEQDVKGASPFSDDEEYVLLPGDAMFRNIPLLSDPKLKLVGLVASHHGASFSDGRAFDDLPEPAVRNAPIVYSYGLRDAGASEARHGSHRSWLPPEADPPDTQKRCYVNDKNEGHPKPEAVAEYARRGWVLRLNTAFDLSVPASRGNSRYGNWLLGPSEMHFLHRERVQACSSLLCPDNDGSRFAKFRMG